MNILAGVILIAVFGILIFLGKKLSPNFKL